MLPVYLSSCSCGSRLLKHEHAKHSFCCFCLNMWPFSFRAACMTSAQWHHTVTSHSVTHQFLCLSFTNRLKVLSNSSSRRVMKTWDLQSQQVAGCSNNRRLYPDAFALISLIEFDSLLVWCSGSVELWGNYDRSHRGLGALINFAAWQEAPVCTLSCWTLRGWKLNDTTWLRVSDLIGTRVAAGWRRLIHINRVGKLRAASELVSLDGCSKLNVFSVCRLWLLQLHFRF